MVGVTPQKREREEGPEGQLLAMLPSVAMPNGVRTGSIVIVPRSDPASARAHARKNAIDYRSETRSIQLSPVYIRIGRPGCSTNRTTSPTTPPPPGAT